MTASQLMQSMLTSEEWHWLARVGERFLLIYRCVHKFSKLRFL